MSPGMDSTPIRCALEMTRPTFNCDAGMVQRLLTVCVCRMMGVEITTLLNPLQNKTYTSIAAAAVPTSTKAGDWLSGGFAINDVNLCLLASEIYDVIRASLCNKSCSCSLWKNSHVLTGGSAFGGCVRLYGYVIMS